ncbi:hypothetical protein [Vannielia sp. SX4]|uniref:hypothetical protein n=1 Tax=Vannielia sp. SX4 TaxID=3463852 RepID=UPI004058C016
MLLERTIIQLDIGPLPPDEARQLGQLGFMQWLAGLPGAADYPSAARAAHARAAPLAAGSPALAEFCTLLTASLCGPIAPLPLAMPAQRRRGGAAAKRSLRMPL